MVLIMSSATGAVELPTRAPIARAGTTVMQALVEMLVLGRFEAGAYLPPEQSLCDEFGVSRTVVRECIKRLQEKGMVVVAQGRGTQVTPFTSWNVLDPLVLGTLIAHDESLGVLDEVSVVRASLEAVMTGEVARAADPAELGRIEAALQRMRDFVPMSAEFLEADVDFHLAVMEASGNRIAGNIARAMFAKARESFRYEGKPVQNALKLTLDEHEEIYAAILSGDSRRARHAMEDHILGSWHRRRFPTAHDH